MDRKADDMGSHIPWRWTFFFCMHDLGQCLCSQASRIFRRLVAMAPTLLSAQASWQENWPAASKQILWLPYFITAIIVIAVTQVKYIVCKVGRSP